MLHMTLDEAMALGELRAELRWLEQYHPGMVRLIALAKERLDTVRMARSCDSFRVGEGIKDVARRTKFEAKA